VRKEVDVERRETEAAIEAILFAMGDSVELEKIAKAVEHDTETTRKVIHTMMDRYREQDRGIQIIELEDSFQMCTKKEMYEYLIRVAKQPKKATLTDAAMETLSIVAYKQPITKAEIDKIRGVKSDHALNKLDGWMHREGLFFLERRRLSLGTLESNLWTIFLRRTLYRWKILKRRLRKRSS
jgi:segregation and condensation protein B